MKQKICLITSAHLSYNPRLLKEADALWAAGYDVRVVAVNLGDAKWQMDLALMASRSWKLSAYDVRKSSTIGKVRWIRAGLRQKVCREVLNSGPGVLDKAYSRYAPELAALALRERADLFIAHNLPALPAAAQAAHRWDALLGFDAEDFHRGEFLDTPGNQETIRLTRLVEEKYIPRCTYLTAASDGIGEAYARCLPVSCPPTILNVFPLSERVGQTPKSELACERQGTRLSLYWYSQVIGADRGLDDVFEAVALLGEKVMLNLRGAISDSHSKHLRERLTKMGIAERVRLLPPLPPQQLIERAACHDVGLALEASELENRRLCVTNKLFAYLLGGLAVAATDTPGQRDIMAKIPDAGIVYRGGDVKALADQLDIWSSDPNELSKARAQARLAAESQFCWDVEAPKLIKHVDSLWGG